MSMCQVFRRTHRRTISHLLVILLLVGIGALPNAILCAAPGGHVAIEITDGGLDCSGLVDSGSSTHQKRPDGCPSNCHDTRLGTAVQCSQATHLTTPPAAGFSIALPTKILTPAGATTGKLLPAFHSPPQVLRTTVIL